MFKTENTGSETYLIYEVGETELLDNLSLGMLTNNKIPGVLSTTYYMKDSVRILRYQISSKVTLESYLAGTISRKKLLTIFRTINGALLRGEEYMLEPFQFILDNSSIYVNVSTSEAYLVCLPLEIQGETQEIKKFFKEILFGSRFETGESGDYLLELSNYLNSDLNFSISGFQKVITRLLNGKEQESIQPIRAQPPVLENHPPGAVPPKAPEVSAERKPEKKSLFRSNKNKLPEKAEPAMVNVGGKGFLIPGVEDPVDMNSINEQKKTGKQKKHKKEKKPKQSIFSFGKKKDVPEPAAESKPEGVVIPVLPERKKPVAMPIGETTVLGLSSGGETTVLGNCPELNRYACLVRKKTGEKIIIRGEVFRLGKEPAYVDYCIKNNPAVSRSHADILLKSQGYVMVDNNSLNHTYVNGIQLAPKEQTVLTDGSLIALADEEFEFKENYE